MDHWWHIKQFFYAQLVVAGGVILFTASFDSELVISVSAGAVGCVFVNWVAARWAFRGYNAHHPQQLVQRLYGAALLKIGIAVTVISAILITVELVNPFALLSTYFIVQTLPAFLTSR